MKRFFSHGLNGLNGFNPLNPFNPWLKTLVVFSLLGFVCGCKVGPKYKTPTAPLTPAFKEPPPANWKNATPHDDTLRGNWWEMFCDQLLNDLESQVNVSNQNIALAEAQFRGARAAVRAARPGLFPTLTVTPQGTRTGGGGGGNRAVVGAGNTIRATGGKLYSVPFDLTYEVDVWG